MCTQGNGMGAADQHLDIEALDELKQIMGDEFSLLIDTFINDSIVRLETIKEAVVAEDPEAIRRTAHSFKGSAGNMGARHLTDLCRRLEELGHSGSSNGAESLLEQLTTEYESVKGALKSI